MIKSLDAELADIHTNPTGSKAFIIADAKDADMAFGITAPGPRTEAKTKEHESDWNSLETFRAQIRDIVRQGIVDVMLLSASNVEALAIEEKLFENSPVTPAARANDTSDIWAVRGGKYPRQASRSFRTATLDHIMYGRIDPKKATMRDVMTRDPEAISFHDTIAVALNKMTVGGFRHVPLVDIQKRPVGVLSMKDIVNYFVEHFPAHVLNVPPDPTKRKPGEPAGAG